MPRPIISFPRFCTHFPKCLVPFQMFIVKQPWTKLPTQKWREKKRNKDFYTNYHCTESSVTIHHSQIIFYTREPYTEGTLTFRWASNKRKSVITGFSECLHTSQEYPNSTQSFDIKVMYFKSNGLISQCVTWGVFVTNNVKWLLNKRVVRSGKHHIK